MVVTMAKNAHTFNPGESGNNAGRPVGDSLERLLTKAQNILSDDDKINCLRAIMLRSKRQLKQYGLQASRISIKQSEKAMQLLTEGINE